MSLAIDAQGIEKRVGNGSDWLDILKGVDLQLEGGHSLAILGRSGAGKTTLLSILAGLDLPSAGRIHLAGQDITALDEEQRAALRAGRIGFVFQSFQLLDSFTALENVRLSVELAGLDEAANRARQALCEIGLEQRQSHLPRQLSGGEKQRVALARAFAGQPQILFADEPTGNLDGQTAERISSLMFDLNQRKSTTLILVTHDETLAARCQHQRYLRDGQLLHA